MLQVAVQSTWGVAVIDDSPDPVKIQHENIAGPEVRCLEGDAFRLGTAFSLDEWFHSVVLKWLKEIRPQPQLIFVNANLKFRPDSLRTDWLGVTLVAHIRY